MIPSTQSSTQITSQASTREIQTSSSYRLNTMSTQITSMATATVVAITFDDIPQQSSTSGIIPNGYKNLNWTNAGYINASTMAATTGYMNGVRSQSFVLYNPTGGNVSITTANGTRFSFDSFYLTSAFGNSLSVTLKTIRTGLATSSAVFTAMTSYSSYIYCDSCTNIDTIILQVEAGSSSTNYSSNETQFIIDNLCISFGH